MNMNRLPLLCVIAAALSAGACGSTTAPTTASTTTSTTTTASITPATTPLIVGQTQTYTLSLTTSSNVVTWTSSNASVLAIDSAGVATGLANGVSTITATSDTGTTATLTVQVVPNYQGSWAGNSTITACTDIAGFAAAGYCSRSLGSVQQLTLTLTQSGLTVSGTMTKAEGSNVLNGSVSGTIGASGDIITLTGNLGGLANGVNLVVTPISWDSLATDTTMTGNWAANITSQQILGIATVQWSMPRLTRVQ